MVKPAKIAVVGAGLIGKRHIQHILAEPEAELTAIVDPAPIGKCLAEEKGVPWFPSLTDLLAGQKTQGVIVATPNQLHLTHGMEAITAGLPALIEKPITDDVASGTKLVEAAERAGVPILVGHYRRHNPMVLRAKEIIESGRLGRIIAVHASCWLMKPDDYFEVSWRRDRGAGPIFVNLIHDMDLLRHLCGEVSSVQAFESNAVRRYPVEDSAVILLRFANGALGTVTVSDTIVAPWSWELTTGRIRRITRQTSLATTSAVPTARSRSRSSRCGKTRIREAGGSPSTPSVSHSCLRILSGGRSVISAELFVARNSH